MANIKRYSGSILLIITGMLLGNLLSQHALQSGVADDRDARNKPRVAFQSGGERSVVILEKISRQIDQLDRRIANIEKAATGTSTPSQNK